MTRRRTAARNYNHYDDDFPLWSNPKQKKSSSSSTSRGPRQTKHYYDTCLPPQGKTYLTIGQDLYAIEEYLTQQQNASLHWYMSRMAHSSAHKKKEEKVDEEAAVVEGATVEESNSTAAPSSSSSSTTKIKPQHRDNSYQSRMPVPRRDDVVPAAIMVYSDIQTLRGLDSPADYGTGIEYADGALEMASPPNNPLGIGLQVGLWLNGTQGCQDIINGKLDRKINYLIYYLSVKCPADKVFLRIGYEFDNPEFGYASDPLSYKAAFQYIAHKCRKHKSCRRRVLMVWHSWAAGLPTGTQLEDFYPGDKNVDWIGVSVFQQFYPNGHVGGTVKDLENVLKFARLRQKPTMIAESTPYGGIDNNPHIFADTIITDDNSTTVEAPNPIWDAWFEPTLRLIKEHDIGMWSYINCNWDIQPMWQSAGFGDTRLSIDASIMDKWHDFVVGNRRFVRATDYELCGNSDYDVNNYYFDDDDDGNYGFKARSRGKKSHDGHYYNHRDFHYDDEDYFERHSVKDLDDDKGQSNSRGSWLWGEERSDGREGLWNAVLPLVMLSSSIAIIYFMYATSRRSRYRRLQRTPRKARVRFAQLDDKADEHDVISSVYDSVRSVDIDEGSSRVTRVGPNLVVTKTDYGTTIMG